jgi:hypothetical protein
VDVHPQGEAVDHVIKDGQNAVRAKIKNAADEVSLFVNPTTAPYTHKALATGQLKKGSTFLEEDSEYQHIGTAIRYFRRLRVPAQAKSARLLMRRDEGWAKALRSRADRIEEAETLELEAQAKRMAAASVGNRPYKRDDVFEQLFGFLRT